MNSEVAVFLRKFLASLYQNGVRDIPFSGAAYNAGVRALQTSLEAMVPEETYESVSDAFVKTPVQEEYNQLQDMLIELNGDIIGFSSLKNPYWRTLSINMTPYYADKILHEATDLAITNEQFSRIAIDFCEAAGVVVWEQF